MRKILFAAPMLLLGAAFLSPAPVLAQGATQATVVSSCGTPPNTYVAGTTRNITQDTTGTTCTSAGGGAGGNVNLTGINGVTPSVGAGATGTGSLRTTQAQDTTTIAGSAPGTAGTPSTNVVSVQGVGSGTALPISAASLPLPTGAATAANQTNVQGAPAATYPTTITGIGCRAATAAPTAVTDGQSVAPMCGTNGQQVVVLGSVAALKVRGHATSTDTGAHTLIAAAATGIKNYITGIQCSRNDAGTSPITLTFSDDQSSTMLLPNAGNGGGNNFVLDASPLATATATAFTFTSGTGTTTVVCNAQGYTGP